MIVGPQTQTCEKYSVDDNDNDNDMFLVGISWLINVIIYRDSLRVCEVINRTGTLLPSVHEKVNKNKKIC